MTRRGRRRWGFCTRITFGSECDVYLDRLRIVQTPWFGLYLHHINRADRERHVHDHPWPFASLILRGGYTEEFCRFPESIRYLDAVVRERRWRVATVHRMPLGRAHRIVSVKPRTTTLVLVGKPSGQEWRFYTEDGPVQWDRYLARWDVLKGSNQ